VTSREDPILRREKKSNEIRMATATGTDSCRHPFARQAGNSRLSAPGPGFRRARP